MEWGVDGSSLTRGGTGSAGLPPVCFKSKHSWLTGSSVQVHRTLLVYFLHVSVQVAFSFVLTAHSLLSVPRCLLPLPL